MELPEAVEAVVKKFKATGGKVLQDNTSGQEINFDSLDSIYASGKLALPNDQIIVGRFSRQGRKILILVNVGSDPYSGKISVEKNVKWLIAHPDSGQVEPITTDKSGELAISLPSHGVIMLIGNPELKM